MRISVVAGGSWPNQRQKLVLQACVCDGRLAVESWEEFYAINQLEELDYASFQHLPLAHWNLRRVGYDHPAMGILKGIRRRAWYENQKKFLQLAADLAVMDDGSSPLLLLKGGALALSTYQDAGLRQMADFDFACEPRLTQQMLDRLEASGWARTTRSPRTLDEGYMRYRHAIGLEQEGRSTLDVHWHLLFRCCSEKLDAEMWAQTEELNLHGRRLRVLRPTAQLLHTLEHGVAYSDAPPIRWVADAMSIIRHGGVDWTRLAEIAERYSLVLQVREGLHYLRDGFGAAIPEEVLSRLDAADVSAGERAEFARLMDPWVDQGMLDSFRAVCFRYERARKADGAPARPGDFGSFLQHHWKLDRKSDVLPHLFGWLGRRLRGARVTEG